MNAYCKSLKSIGMLGLTVLAGVGSASSVSAAPEAIGAERCGACHQKEYEDWKGSPHARALARLSNLQQKDPVCRGCHTMVPGSNDASLTGVQCESCHGLGSLYAPQYVMKDEVLAQLLGLEAITEKTCAPCHSSAAPNIRPFDFGVWVKEVDHKPDTPPTSFRFEIQRALKLADISFIEPVKERAR